MRVPAAGGATSAPGSGPVETRAALAQLLIDTCVELFGLDSLWIEVEFTQHAGDEMYHPHLGGWNNEWTGNERL